MKYQIYSDESGNNQYRSIGVLSAPKESIENLNNDLTLILKDNGRGHIEFKELDGDSRKETIARAFIETGIDYCCDRKIRVDIMTWNTQDSRHSIVGRDDNKNLEVMYYKSLKHVKQMWRHKTIEWGFYPDEHSAINWQQMVKYLERTNLGEKSLQGYLFDELRGFSFPTILDHREMISEEETTIQLIDLFTGFARYSFEKGGNFLKWRRNKRESDQYTLFDNSEPVVLSRSDKSRFKILEALDAQCKQRKMGVSMKNNKCLFTYDPKHPLNFWLYIPQRETDKAPIRLKREK